MKSLPNKTEQFSKENKVGLSKRERAKYEAGWKKPGNLKKNEIVSPQKVGAAIAARLAARAAAKIAAKDAARIEAKAVAKKLSEKQSFSMRGKDLSKSQVKKINNQNAAASTYKTTDLTRTEAAKKAAETRRMNELKRISNAKRQGMAKGAVSTATVIGVVATAADKKKKPSK